MEVNQHSGCEWFLPVRYGLPPPLFIEYILDAVCSFPEGAQLGIEEAIGISMRGPDGGGMEVLSDGGGF